MPGLHDKDPIFVRLCLSPANETLCRLLERQAPQVHTDLVDELDAAVRGLDDVSVWCPNPKGFSFYGLYRRSDILFALASGMSSIALRLPPPHFAAAQRDGGTPWQEAGPDWIRLPMFDVDTPIATARARLRQYCALAHAAAATIPNS